MKPSPGETQCGGPLLKWLKLWVSRLPRALTPWPGWPASRLILARFSLENCSSPYTDRVTTDTITWLRLWPRAPRPAWWRAADSRSTRKKSAESFLRWTTRSTRCTAWPRAHARSGARPKPGRKIGGVAGSVGKTTTKEILAALVAARFRVLKTQGNLNNEYGLPLTLLKLDDQHDAAVIEMGMSHRGELARLARIAPPDVGVITRIAVEHLEFFSSIDEIALAERELIENLAWPHATAVLNADDERVERFAEVARGPVLWFSTSSGSDWPAVAGAARNFARKKSKSVASRLRIRFRVAGRPRARLELPLIGRHNVMNAVAALAAASVWGIGAEDAQRVFPQMQPADKRGEVVKFRGRLYSDQRQLQLQPHGPERAGGIASGDAGVFAPHSGRGRNARAGRIRAGAASRVRPPRRRFAQD